MNTRCKYGFGQHWRCLKTATHRVTTRYGAVTIYCEAHARKVGVNGATIVALEEDR